MFTDVDTSLVHCQRHIHVYHFVYLRLTQGGHEYSYWVNPLGGGGLFVLVIVTVSVGILLRGFWRTSNQLGIVES